MQLEVRFLIFFYGARGPWRQKCPGPLSVRSVGSLCVKAGRGAKWCATLHNASARALTADITHLSASVILTEYCLLPSVYLVAKALGQCSTWSHSSDASLGSLSRAGC